MGEEAEDDDEPTSSYGKDLEQDSVKASIPLYQNLILA